MDPCSNCLSERLLGRAKHYRTSPEHTTVIHNLLHTNDTATDLEISHIKDSLLPELDADTARIDALISDLQKAKSDLATTRTHFSTLLSPFRRLPVELVHEIMCLSVGSWSYYRGEFVAPSVLCSYAPQWTLASVSKTWRAMALSCAFLWSFIDLERWPDIRNLNRLRLALSRSSHHSSITLGPQPPVNKEMLAVALAECHCWGHLQLVHGDAEQTTDPEGVFTAENNCFPSLQSLSLTTSDDSQSVNADGPIQAFASCTRLRQYSYGGGKRAVTLPWTQLTSLRLHSSSWQGAASPILRHIPECIHLRELVCLTSAPPTVPSFIPEILPLCPALVVETNDGALFMLLDFPNLDRVILRTNDLSSRRDRETLRGLENAECVERITSLHLNDISVKVQVQRFMTQLDKDALNQLRDLLKMATSVTTLHLGIQIYDALSDPRKDGVKHDPITRAILKLKSPSFLPCLASLSLFCNVGAFRGQSYFPLIGDTESVDDVFNRPAQADLVRILEERWHGTLSDAYDSDTSSDSDTFLSNASDSEGPNGRLEEFRYTVQVDAWESEDPDDWDWDPDPDMDPAEGQLVSSPVLLEPEAVDKLEALARDGMKLGMRTTGVKRDPSAAIDNFRNGHLLIGNDIW